MSRSSVSITTMAMTLLILSTGTICAALSFLHVAGIAIAIARVRKSAAGHRVPEDGAGISIIRPVCGVDNFAEEALGSSFCLACPRHEILFCVAQPNDPVVPLVRRLMAAHPQTPARLLVGNERISANPKLNNIVKGWAAAQYDWIVMADSNVLMRRDMLERLMAAWRPDTGLVCSPPVGCLPDGLWAELECAFLNTYQARWQLTADAVGIGFAQGKTMLWRRDILEAAGGMRALAAEMAEDAAATKLVRGSGLRVRLVDAPFAQPLGWRSAAEVWQRQVRWARLRRNTFRLFFIPEILTGGLVPLVACLVCAMATDGPATIIAAAFAAAWYGGEALLAHTAGWHLSYRSPLVWVLRDALLPVLWLAGWRGKDFVWRGTVMRIAHRSSSA
jgi:ceramide glucosyltransferase